MTRGFLLWLSIQKENICNTPRGLRLDDAYPGEKFQGFTDQNRAGDRTGDNRIPTSTASGYKTSSRALSHTVTFVLYLGDHHFGTLTAFVTGSSAENFSFTSALPLLVMKGRAPILLPEVRRAAQVAMALELSGILIAPN